MLKFPAAVLATFIFVTAAWASPEGEYSVEGTSPGGSGKYTGQVTVAKTGDTFRVTWLVGGTTFMGTGIGNKDSIAVSYMSDDGKTGLAFYGSDGGDWSGVWTYSGGNQMGAEVWTRK